jgi:uncharacterized small protein (DUF1192 family)
MLAALDRAVMDAVSFLCDVDEKLTDGSQTAREVLSHLVFWHREYVSVANARVEGRRPALKSGTFAELNAQAYREFVSYSMPELAQYLASLQEELVALLQRLLHWRMDFPVKQGGRWWSVEDRIPAIETHIRNHVARLKRAASKDAVETVYRKAS